MDTRRSSDGTVEIPACLAWLAQEPGGKEWLASLPNTVARCVEAWSLRLEAPFTESYLAWVAPGVQGGGTEIVLKVQFAHRESDHEALALGHWAGDGAVRLLDHRPQDAALLLERCVPGTSLGDLEPDEQLHVYLDLLPRLWKPAGAPPFRSLDEEAGYWLEGLEHKWRQAGRRMERRLVEAGADALRQLIGTQGEQVLLHQDLHSLNILRSEREPWLAIDPKPLAGEREFSLAPIVRAFAQAEPKEHVLRRLDLLASALDLDRERARLWTIAQTVAWSLHSAPESPRVNLVRWLADG